MYRREKQRILSQIDALDAKAENLGVSATDREERRELESRLRFVIREEKIKWFQRSKEKEVLEGIVTQNTFMLRPMAGKGRVKFTC